MKKSHLFILLLVSLLIIAVSPSPNVLGCAIGPYDSVQENELVPSDISFFQSDLGYDSLLSKYLYIAHPNSVENSPSVDEDETNPDSKIAEINLQEWGAYFENKPDKNALNDFIYVQTRENLEKTYNQISSGQPISDQKNAFFHYIRDSKQTQVLQYMIFVRKCEPFVVYTGDPWDSDEQLKKVRDPQVMEALINDGLIQYKQAGSSFLKLRYAFQIIRLANFAGFYQDCVKYYDTLIPSNINSVYLYYSMLLKAGALFKLDHEAESLVLDSYVFDQCVPLMDKAFFEFQLPKPDVWDQCLQMVGNKHRSATLWLLWALKDNERINLEPLVKMVQAEPKSPRTEVILTRTINNVEKSLLTPEYFYPGTQTDQTKIRYITDFLQFIETIDLTTVRHPALWQLTAGYLDLLLKKYDEAELQFEKAAKADPANGPLQGQIRLLRSLSSLSRSNIMTKELETVVLPTLNDISAWKPTYNRPLVSRSFLILIAQKYIRNHQFVQAYYCIDKTGYADLPISLLKDSSSVADLDGIIALASKTGKSPMESWLTKNVNYGLEDLYYIRGTKLLRHEHYTDALFNYEKVSAKTMAKYDTIPLVTSFDKIYYDSKTGLYEKNPPTYSKTAFLKRINALLDEAKKNPAHADLDYFKIANGFFHTPAWSYYNFDKYFPWFESSERNPDYPFYDKYLNDRLNDFDIWGSNYPNRLIAWKFYEKALQTTKDREMAAQCAFMAAACQTRFSLYDACEPKGKDRGYYFALMKVKYADTQYYKHVIKECADMKQYVNGK